MIERPYTIAAAAFSNLIAFAMTGAILGVWYVSTQNGTLALLTATIGMGSLAIVAAAERVLVCLGMKKEKIDLSLKSDANQWAPIAGASMIVGWSALKANFATHEGTLLILIGLLYSLWCIALAADVRQSSKARVFLCLFISHLVVPAIIGLGLAYSIN